MQKINQKYINNLVLKALEEDLKPNGDITTKLLNSRNKIVQAKIISKQSGIYLVLIFARQLSNFWKEKVNFYRKLKMVKKLKEIKLLLK